MKPLASEHLRPAASLLNRHQLPPLTYDHAALEPCIDARTMRLHHDIHHGGYVEKLNAALQKTPQLLGFPAIWLLGNLDQVPEAVRTAVHHNAGGHANHSMFWRSMKPGAAREPEGRLCQAINRNFGSVAAFKARFEEAGAGLFGSGWVWLAQSRQDAGKLEVITSSGHDHPLMQDRVPLLLNDVWEHAYYLRYESRRLDYLKAWWSVVDWEEAARRFERCDASTAELWEAEGGQLLETAAR